MLDTSQKLEFRAPVIEDAEWAAPILYQSGLQCCEFSFTTIFMWRKYYQNEIARCGDYVFIRSGDVEPFYLLPVGGDLHEGIDILLRYEHERNEQLILFGADETKKNQIEQWYPGMFDWQPSPNDFDYLYNTEDLAVLSGKKYHSKRNHIAAFSADFSWSYETIDDSNREEVIEMAREWCRERGGCSDPGLKNEHCAIRESLRYRKELSLCGGLIRVDDKVVAITLGSPISSDVFDIHVEKALPEYGGAYTVINREFAARELQGRYKIINRENDLGIEGLQRAKKSYYPVRILEKYLATEKS